MKITPNVPTDAFTLKASATWDVLFDDNNKAVAIFSRKSRLAELAMIAPEMYELLEEYAHIADADTAADWFQRRQALLDKIEGGGE